MSCCGGGDIDTDSETEADLTESIEEQTKQDRGRRAFLRLLRRVVALVVLALFLYQQPFMTKRKSKVVPLHLALNRAFQWAGSSPIVLESPQFQLTMNVTSRALLTPLEYVKVKTSKRSIGTAYGKTEQVLGRLVDGNATTLYKMAAQPMPNIPVIGAYLVTLGSALAPFCPGAEYLLISGCGCFLYGCDGMQPQPELYVVALLALFGLYLRSSANAPFTAKVVRRTGKRKQPNRQHKEHCH